MSYRLPLDARLLREVCNLEADEYNPHGRGLGCCVWTARIKPEVEAWITENLSGTVAVEMRLNGGGNWDVVFEHDKERTWFRLVHG